jgi:hypothetical protein
MNIVYRDFPSNSNPSVNNSSAVDINALAQDVIAGKYGDGEARKTALGANYDAVQARVNEILGVSSYSVGGTYTVVASALNVRSQPTINSNSVAVYYAGEPVTLDNWYTIADGYVWGKYTGKSGNIRYIAVQVDGGEVYLTK